MKTKLLALLMCILMLTSLVACNKNTETPDDASKEEVVTTAPEETTENKKTGIWGDAIHTEDKEFGEGAKTIKLEVIADGKSVTFTIKTDSDTLGEALTAHSLIEGEEGQFGLYIKKVNGMLADYNVDQTYWGLTKDGEYVMSGADTTTISDGEHYELTKTK